MKLQVRSNGNQVEISNDVWAKSDDNFKAGFIVLSTEDAPVKKEQTVKNELSKEPPTGQAKSATADEKK